MCDMLLGRKPHYKEMVITFNKEYVKKENVEKTLIKIKKNLDCVWRSGDDLLTEHLLNQISYPSSNLYIFVCNEPMHNEDGLLQKYKLVCSFSRHHDISKNFKRDILRVSFKKFVSQDFEFPTKTKKSKKIKTF